MTNDVNQLPNGDFEVKRTEERIVTEYPNLGDFLGLLDVADLYVLLGFVRKEDWKHAYKPERIKQLRDKLKGYSDDFFAANRHYAGELGIPWKESEK